MKLIRISAIWCGSCIIMRPRIDEIIKKYNLESIEYDYDFDDEVSNYNIGDKLPVFILEKEGTEITRIVGEKTTEEIEKIIGESI